MKKLEQILAKHPDKKKLINAVINHIGISAVADVLLLGPAAGFTGFIYAHDTSKFYRHYRKIINPFVKERALIYDIDTAKMILTFPGLTHYPEITENSINQCLIGTLFSDDSLKSTEHIISLVVLHEICKLFLDA